MSSSSKPTTANAVLCWMGSKQCPSSNITLIVTGYWQAYDKEYVDLNRLLLALKKKEEVVAEQKRKVDEAQKRKEVVVPVALGSGNRKGKLKEVVQDMDSECEVEEEFRETCLNCEENKAICNPYKWAMHGALKMINEHIKALKAEAKEWNTLAGEELYHKYNLQQLEIHFWAHSAFLEAGRLDIGLCELELKFKVVSQSVSEDRVNDTEQGHVHIISKHNFVVCHCTFNMKQLAAWYALGKGYEAKAFLMDARGGIEVADITESGKKRSRDDKDVGSRFSKKAKVEGDTVRKEAGFRREGKGSGGGSEKEKGKEKEIDTGSKTI
ncbi:hypothetical protein M422DRAFT_256524 [Sphaerobolus stellatus SS14]|uniref:Uncharacterized protein n=1 Tax=Sphaerobolus stellatus (strain SS14) TaxID=990650 RepID=A0A0C9UBQ2_SPHS4|nr:hypothetical protein M422DRAFT_256524 [Sphaerobolus stellatus SS14]